MVKAIARAFRWRKLLETGRIRHRGGDRRSGENQRVLREPGAAIDPAGPEIVEAILDGRQPAEITLAVLMRPFPAEWTASTSLYRPVLSLGSDLSQVLISWRLAYMARASVTISTASPLHRAWA